ncbi:allantoicase [Acinetobacter larvae]|uniref:Probable allantoicase n=1 Tax=Acinetobacter larvae TaxID=1789224 RepID=A0A1B2LYR1_9GAMM|nr:allantoicase [Acinetobacter larvae]AOA58084.1 allantoicase [Acinetobacter larvae]
MSTVIAKAAVLPAALHGLTNLADVKIGASVLACSDEFFAKAERMLQSDPARFIAGKYDDHGKWMDGWETRRKREAGYDWCIIRLGVPGEVHGFDIDTSFFTGNYPVSASIEGCYVADDHPAEADWQHLVANSALTADQHHFFQVTAQKLSHIRLNIFPDGGIARLRVYGRVILNPQQADAVLDLIALKNGGRIVAYSDAHFGHPSHLLNPDPAQNMGDGWETQRRREPGHDWCIIALGQAGHITEITVDTAHFKGNFPASCSIQAAYVRAAIDAQLVPQSLFWSVLLPEQILSMDQLHHYRINSGIESRIKNHIEKRGEILPHQKINYIRLNMYPDGGISRLRLWGTLSDSSD